MVHGPNVDSAPATLAAAISRLLIYSIRRREGSHRVREILFLETGDQRLWPSRSGVYHNSLHRVFASCSTLTRQVSSLLCLALWGPSQSRERISNSVVGSAIDLQRQPCTWCERPPKRRSKASDIRTSTAESDDHSPLVLERQGGAQ